MMKKLFPKPLLNLTVNLTKQKTHKTMVLERIGGIAKKFALVQQSTKLWCFVLEGIVEEHNSGDCRDG